MGQAISVPDRSRLVQEFKAHGRSREAIEMAFDDILKQKMKVRHKYGFKPPKTGRRSDVEGEATVGATCLPYCKV